MKVKDYTGIRNSAPLPDPKDIAIPSDIDDLVDDYTESTCSQLDELEEAILQFEQGNNKKENLGAIKRILHKIKGESAMVGIEDMAILCHETEYAVEEIKEKDLPNMLLRFKDWTLEAIQNLRK
jgi:chemotaxis protein histidine kinase CheA